MSKIIFGILGFIAYIIAFSIFSDAQSAIHENLAVNLLAVGTIFLVGAGIIDAIHSLKTQAKIEPASKESTTSSQPTKKDNVASDGIPW